MAVCAWCQEDLEDGRRHPMIQAMHIECGLRAVAGPLAHHRMRCSCFVPGSDEHDPPGMTMRQAAVAVWDYFQILQAQPVGATPGCDDEPLCKTYNPDEPFN